MTLRERYRSPTRRAIPAILARDILRNPFLRAAVRFPFLSIMRSFYSIREAPMVALTSYISAGELL